MCGFAQFIAIHIMSGEVTRINATTSSEAETTAIDNFDAVDTMIVMVFIVELPAYAITFVCDNIICKLSGL